ncbi:MAG: proton-conducting transporter membrane subunit, partial [Thermodesulfobacteriota bacterium]
MIHHQTTSTIVSWVVFIPVIGAGFVLAAVGLLHFLKIDRKISDELSRLIGLVCTFAAFVLSLKIWGSFQTGTNTIQFVHRFVWIDNFNIEYFVGIDGINISLVILTTFITLLACIASLPWWGYVEETHFSKRMTPGYVILLLILETGMLGTFCALDFFLFYIFWEIMLLPMYFLIGIWGGPRKEYAAIK